MPWQAPCQLALLPLGFIPGVIAGVIAIVIAAPAPASSAAAPSPAERILDDSGGRIGSYLSKYEALRKSGHGVAIDGTCASACTLLLGVIPHNRICVTPRAVLAFHAAWDPSFRASRPMLPRPSICGRGIRRTCATGSPGTAD